MAAAREIRFGLRLSQFVGGPSELVELAVRAEQAGFDQVWFPSDPFLVNAWALATAVGMRTERIAIGGLGANPYLQHPAEIATHAATLDSLTGGRALLGAGLHGVSMLTWLGYDASDVVARTRETIVIVRALLAGERPAGELVHFTWADEWRLRFALARPAIPIYVTPYGPELDELAGELGDGSLPMLFPPALAGPVVARTLGAAERAGRAPSAVDIAGCVWLSIAEDRTSAEDLLRPMIVHYGSYMTDEALAAIGVERGDFAAIEERKAAGDEAAAAAHVTGDMLRLGIAGAPADVIGRIEEVAAAGVTQINLGGPLGPDPAAAVALMGASVIPRFR